MSNPPPVPCSKETLSSLMDGEVDARTAGGLLATLCSSSELRAEWIAFHLVGDALRSSEVAAGHSDGFGARVAAAIAREPAIMAPHALRTSPSPLRRYLLPGIAVAASAAVIGFVAVPLLRNAETPPAQQASVAPAQTVVATTPAERPEEAAARRAAATVANARTLQAYLAAHRELTAGVALPRATPYLRASAEQPEGR
jgi:sigma-E factor negative regulatory protein RseA